MADEQAQQAQIYDSTLKEWILQQPGAIIAVLLPGAIYQETLNIEVVRPTFRADKVFRVLYEDDEYILHIEFESGSDNAMSARLLGDLCVLRMGSKDAPLSPETIAVAIG